MTRTTTSEPILDMGIITIPILATTKHHPDSNTTPTAHTKAKTHTITTPNKQKTPKTSPNSTPPPTINTKMNKTITKDPRITIDNKSKQDHMPPTNNLKEGRNNSNNGNMDMRLHNRRE